jgi:hypothetical protein
VRTDVVDGISGVTVRSVDPDRTAARWAAVLETEVVDRAVALDGAVVRFVPGEVDSLVEVTVTGPSPIAPIVIGGVTFST